MESKVVSVKFTESKKKIGRPKLHGHLENNLLTLISDLKYKCLKSVNNHIYETIMVGIIQASPEVKNFSYLVDIKNERIHRRVILTALGRYAEKYGEEEALKLVELICAEKWQTKKVLYVIKKIGE